MTKRITLKIILTAYSLLLVINSLTIHTHTLSDGKQVVHSHLTTSNENGGSHSHTEEEFDNFYFISLNNGFFENVIYTLPFKAVFFSYLKYLSCQKIRYFTLNFHLLRAPPQNLNFN